MRIRSLLVVGLMFLLFLYPNTVNAEKVSCDYGDSGLVFEYSDSNPKPTVISDFISGKRYFHFLSIIESGTDKTVTQHIDMDQEWYAKYHETPCACPTKLYVCTSSEYSINFPTLKGSVFSSLVVFLETLDDIASGIDFAGDIINGLLAGVSYGINAAFGTDISLSVGEWDLSSIITEDLIADLGENAYAFITFNERHLYILTEDEYKKSDFSGKKKGFYSDENEYFMSNKDILCESGVCSFWLFDFLTNLLADAKTNLDLIIDLFTEDHIVLAGYREISCKTVDYIGECDTFDANCDFFVKDETSYKNLITEYNNCKNDKECEAKVLNKISYLEEKISAKCDKVLKNYLYSETQKECVKKCVDLSRILNDWKKGSDLYQEKLGQNNNNQCRMSERLVSWLMKIIEWIRYIVPTLLIILSILEFIKAIASDSEDEIRKVGGRFVKRLIVSALIFVLPLLLEFLLGIFNIPIKDYCLK